jgi:hypothetical protein
MPRSLTQKPKQGGFTVVTAYPLITGADRLSAKIHTESEASFVFRKVSEILYQNQISAISVGSGFITVSYPTGSASIRQGITTTNSIELSRGGVYVPLTASRIIFSNFSATHSSPTEPQAPHVVVISFDAGGVSYSREFHVFYE